MAGNVFCTTVVIMYICSPFFRQDPAVGLFADRPTDPPIVPPKDRLKSLAASLQRRRETLSRCAEDLRGAAVALRASAAADRAMVASVSTLRTRYQVEWDRGTGRLEVDACFLPQRLRSLLPPDLVQGTGWSMPLARDKEGGLVAVGSIGGEAIQGLPAVQGELQRLQQSYWSSLGLFELRRQLRSLALDVQARKACSIQRISALLAGLGTAPPSTPLVDALRLYVDILYLAWVRRDLQRSRDPFARNMSAAQPKPSDVALPLIALDAHARARVDVRAALAQMGRSSVASVREEPMSVTKTAFVLALPGGGPEVRLVVEEERVALEAGGRVQQRAVGLEALSSLLAQEGARTPRNRPGL